MVIWIKEKQSGKKVSYEIQTDIRIPKYEGKMKINYMKKYEEEKK